MHRGHQVWRLLRIPMRRQKTRMTLVLTRIGSGLPGMFWSSDDQSISKGSWCAVRFADVECAG